MVESEFIAESIGKSEFLCQLAEECAELAQAALKLRRVITGVNPTPVTHEEAVAALIEEFADVTLCAKLVGCNANDIEVRKIQDKKLTRWIKRLKRKEE